MLGALDILWHGPEFARNLRKQLPWNLLPPWPDKVLDDPSDDLRLPMLGRLHMMHEPLKRLIALHALARRELIRLV